MSDLTVEILKEIRDEARKTNERLDRTRVELTDRIDRLEKRQTETDVRLSTELAAVVGAIYEVRDAVVDDRKLRHRVDDHESRIRALEVQSG